MNNWIYAAIAGFVLLILMGVGLYFFVSLEARDESALREPTTGSAPVVNNAPGPSTPAGGALPQTDEKVLLATFTKATVSARDFRGDPDVLVVGDRTGAHYYSLGSIPDDPSVYIVSGATSSQSSKVRGYEILYFSDGTFTVRIVKEPIAELRRAAMDDLLRRLAISANDLCTVLIDVRVDVQGVLAGKHIGFPGCKGARILPGDVTN